MPGSLLVQFAEEPRLRQAPIPAHRAFRDLEYLSDLGDVQPAEETQLHDLTPSRIERSQSIQRIIERDEVNTLRMSDAFGFNERDSQRLATAFGAAFGAGQIHQDAAHDLRGKDQKMGAVLPLDALVINQPQISLIDERRGLQQVSGILTRHVPLG